MESIPTHAKDDKDGQSNKVVVENAQTDNTSTNDLCIYICNITNDLHIYIYIRDTTNQAAKLKGTLHMIVTPTMQ